MSTLYTTRLGVLVLAVAAAGGSSLTQDASPSLAGTWRVALRESDGVELDFRMTFSVRRSTPVTWEAFTREGAARELVGAGQAALGALFGKMPPRGALIYIGGGALEVDGSSLRLTGSLESPFLGRRDVAGVLVNDRLQGDLFRPSTAVIAGRIEAVRDPSAEPLRNYAALASAFEQLVRTKIFDPALPSQPAFQNFFKELSVRLARAHDDLDVVGAFQGLKSTLQSSHFAVIRNPRLAAQSLAETLRGDPKVNPDDFVRLSFFAPGVAHLRVTRWVRGAPAIHRAFERLETTKTPVLLLDIRGNSGGDHSSVAPYAHLIREPAAIGVFVGRRWYSTRGSRPPTSDFAPIPVLSSDAAAEDLLRSLDDHGAVRAQAVPHAPHFAGHVYLLVDSRTASASEPLAHVLKVTRRATIIGERTAGSMLMALPYALPDGWVATIPIADFIAADGTRLEGRGVDADVKVAPDQVFLAAADRIEIVFPFSGAALRAGSLEGLKRPQDAERAYRAALRVANQLLPRPSPESRAWVHKRLAALLIARGDRGAALREYAEVLKLVPDDAEALKALQGR